MMCLVKFLFYLTTDSLVMFVPIKRTLLKKKFTIDFKGNIYLHYKRPGRELSCKEQLDLERGINLQ